tara:strand:- start:36 stop:167 length:132 start_codon:yes stop_codon:yes gene_type:complete
MNNDSNSGSDRQDNERRDREDRRKQSVPVENDRRLAGDDRRKV